MAVLPSLSPPVSSSCIMCMRGPILYTAPHGRGLYRNTDIHTGKGRVELHKRERFTTELCVMLADASVHNKDPSRGLRSSFAIWGIPTRGPGTAEADNDECQQAYYTDPSDLQDLDPNYLRPHEFHLSPWFHGLVHFRDHFIKKNIPMLHVDIHGKVDRRSDLDIDIGIKPMEVLWKTLGNPGTSLLSTQLKNSLMKRLSAVVKNHKSKSTAPTAAPDPELEWGVEPDPALHGYWGPQSDAATSSHQSILLGMPAVQLEFPYTLRKSLVESPQLVASLSRALVDSYEEVIVPHFVPSKYPASITAEPLKCPVPLSLVNDVNTHNLLHALAYYDAVAPQQV